MQDAVLIQQACGKYVDLLRITARRHVDYAHTHGMDYWCIYGEAQGRGWHPAWDKIFLLERALGMGYEWVFWVDADAVIVDMAIDLREALFSSLPHLPDEDKGVVGTVRHPGPPEHWNLGVMFVHNSLLVKKLAASMIVLGPGGPPWFEQTIFNALVEGSPVYHRVAVQVDDRWNSTFRVNESPRPVIKAWHGGWAAERKLAWLRDELTVINLGVD